MAALGELVVSLSANTAKFNEGLNKANYQAQKTFSGMKANIATVGSALGATFTATVFLEFLKGAVQAADAINDVAKANEVAVSSVLRLSQALSLNGGEADSAGRLFSTLTNKIDEAAGGSENAQKAFAKIGVSLDDLAALDSQALFEKTIQGLAKLEDPLKRNALASDLLGKAVRGVDIQGLADDYSSSQGQFGDAEQAFNDIGAALDKLDKFTTNVSTSLATTFAPALSGTVSVVDDLIFGFDKLEQNIRKASNAQKESSLFKAAPTINDKPMAGQFNLGEFAAKPVIREVIDPAVIKKQEEAARRAKEVQKELMEARKKATDEANKEEIRRLNVAIWVNEQIALSEQKKNDEIAEMTAKRMDIEQQRANENFAEAQRLAAESTSKQQSEFEDLRNAIDGYSKDMASSLADFMTGTESNFTDMINSMLKDLLRLTLQKTLFDPITSSLSGALSGGGGSFLGSIGSALSEMFSGGVSASAGAYSIDANPYLNFGGFRAMGGSVSSGSSYIVGERGPELFTPNSSGSITPNNALGSNVSVVINNNSQAQATAVETKDARGNRRIEVTIGDMVASEIKRNGSTANQAIGITFATRPRLVGR